MEIIKTTKDLGRLIQSSDEFKALQKAKEANDQDKELQEEIEAFNQKKLEVNQAMNAKEKDAQKLNNLNSELRALYENIMKSPSMIAYNNASQAMTSIMNQVNSILQMSLNGEDPDTFDPNAACGCSASDCSSCAGCS